MRDTRLVTAGEAVRGTLRYPVSALLFSMMVSLLIAGCESGGAQVTSPAPPSTSASTAPPGPTLTPTATSVVVPTSTAVPEPTQTSTAEKIAMETGANAQNESVAQNGAVTLTIIYDNNAHNPELTTAWGFACLVETAAGTVLFDTGADSPTLMGNIDKLGLNPQAIDAVVLSHIHGDHVGGLIGLLDTGISPLIYAPAAWVYSGARHATVQATRRDACSWMHTALTVSWVVRGR